MDFTFKIGAMKTVKPIKMKIKVPVTRCSLEKKEVHQMTYIHVKTAYSSAPHSKILIIQQQMEKQNQWLITSS